MEYHECSDAVRRLAPKIGSHMGKIRELIEDIPILSEIQKKFFTLMIQSRYDEVLQPIYQKLMIQ